VYIAFLSGGKDSYYAVYKSGLTIDLGLVFVYEFSRPNPHTLNLGKTIETLLLAKIPIIVVKLSKGKEFAETLNILRKLNPSVIIAGDVYIEEHLKYMEKLSTEVGAKLIEPLWGYDPVNLLYEEIEKGIKPLIIGCRKDISEWLGQQIDQDNIEDFIEKLCRINADPLGEHGEYHTIVINGPLHIKPLEFKPLSVEDCDEYRILRLI
jgi:uncharacterized protein (TIGR00290 family)